MSSGEISALKDTFAAAADLSAEQYRGVITSGTAGTDCALAGANAADGLGVLLNDPVSGDEAEVGMIGNYPVKYGGTVTADDKLTTDASGNFVTAATGENVWGRALQSGVSGDVMTAYINTMVGGVAP